MDFFKQSEKIIKFDKDIDDFGESSFVDKKKSWNQLSNEYFQNIDKKIGKYF